MTRREPGTLTQEAAISWSEALPRMQIAVFVMAGGGLLGRFAAEMPGKFYIDARCGRLPYKEQEIMAAVRQLAQVAAAAGLDPDNLPAMPGLPNLGVF